MKRLIVRLSIFLSPVLLLILVNVLFRPQSGGDLSRVGLIPVSQNYRKQFRAEFNRPFYYTNLSEVNFEQPLSYTMFTIGDSFSNQGRYGYQSYVSEDDSIDVLHFNTRAIENPIESLRRLVKGDFFDKIQVEYVVLQSAERHFARRASDLSQLPPLPFDDVRQLLGATDAPAVEKEKKTADIFSSAMVKFPLYTLLYELDDNAFVSQVYKFGLEKPCFSYGNDLLCFQEDIQYTSYNNNQAAVKKLNEELNALAADLRQKGVRLIVLPSPDKYDIYFEYLLNVNHPKPLFFQHLRPMKKDYIFIDAKEILSRAIDQQLDVYFYEDTHWSPIASRLIANKIISIVKNPEHRVESESGLGRAERIPK